MPSIDQLPPGLSSIAVSALTCGSSAAARASAARPGTVIAIRQSGVLISQAPIRIRSRRRHEGLDHLLHPGMVEADLQLVAVDALHRPHPELLVDHPVADRETRRRPEERREGKEC